MDGTIISALLYNDYHSMHTNISEVSFFVKDTETCTDIFLVVDVDNHSVTKELYNNIVNQVEHQYSKIQRSCCFTGLFMCTNLSDVSEICRDERENDKRYAVLKFTDEIVLFEFQDNRVDSHIEMIEKWKYGSKNELKDRREEKSTKENQLPFDITPVNSIMVVINIIVFIFLATTGKTNDAMFLYEKGGLLWSSVIYDNEYYRLFTSMFMHSGIEHLAGNMISLLFVGSYLEKMVGHSKYVLIYFTSGVLAGVTSVLYNMNGNSDIVSVGASGAIFGLIGALIAVFLLDKTGNMRQDMTRLTIYALISVIAGISSQEIDNMAHIGGLISGFFCAIALIKMYPIEKNE